MTNKTSALLSVCLFITGVVVFVLTHNVVVAQSNPCTLTVTNTNDSGSGSLRDAITTANLFSDTDYICFDGLSGSGVQTITLTSSLPAIIRPVTIDGTTAPGWNNTPLIELNGANVNSGTKRGLYISGNGAGSNIKGLIINRFAAQGIFIDTQNVTVTSNFIGTTSSGLSGAGNGSDGVGIFSGTNLAAANGNVIGGTTSADRNIISGNAGNGIGISAQDGGTANNNIVQGNYIGTNLTGTAAIPNGGDGFLLNNSRGNGTLTGNMIGGTTGVTVGGPCTGACNLLSGNIANGAGLWHSGASANTFKGNYVGTNANGNGAIANGDIGLEVNETPDNIVGGTAATDRNVLSGNKGAGLFLTGAAATGNVVQGNYIGTNAAGTTAVANVKMGIGIGASPNAVGAHSNTIGGTVGTTPGNGCLGACNLISGNSQNGIFISGSESYGNTFVGNYIGTNAAGTIAVGNGGDGIGLLNTPNTAIGDGTANGQNIIASNGSNGVIVVGNASTGNRVDNNIIGYLGFGNTASGVVVSSATDTAILRNSINYNGLLGIDLDNNGTPNLNDAGDGDAGANRMQNFPNIYAAKTSGGSTKIAGQFNGTPNTNFRLEFFTNDGCNAGKPYNFGEGQNYIGSTDISTDQFGNTAWGFTSASPVNGGKYITSTATRKIGSVADETSEFSLCRLVNVSRPAVTNGASWFLKDDLTTGGADLNFNYGLPSFLLMCAWDTNQPGVKLPVVVNNSTWFERASFTTGVADNTFQYGFSGAKPVCGDWDGNGIDTPGLYAGGTWYLRNSNTSGVADTTFGFGSGGSIVEPLAGDWDGNGTDTIGIFTPGHFQLRNSNTSGTADAGDFFFNPPNIKKPVVGDWDGNGTDTIGIFDTSNSWILRNSNSSGPIDVQFQFGFNGATPVVWH